MEGVVKVGGKRVLKGWGGEAKRGRDEQDMQGSLAVQAGDSVALVTPAFNIFASSLQPTQPIHPSQIHMAHSGAMPFMVTLLCTLTGHHGQAATFAEAAAKSI